MRSFVLLMRCHEWRAIGTNNCKHHHVRLHNRIVYNSGVCPLLPITRLLRPFAPKNPQHFALYSPTLYQTCQLSQLPPPERPPPLPLPRLLLKPLRRPRPRRQPRLPLLPTPMVKRRGERPGRRLTPPTSTRVRVFDSVQRDF